MKILPILLFCLFCSFGFSQKSSSIDFKMGGDVTFRIINSAERTTITDSIIERRNEYEKIAYNYNIGLHYNKRISSSLYFRTGLSLTVLGYETDISSTFKLPIQLDEDGNPLPSSSLEELGLDDIKYQHRYYFIDVPLLIRYEFSTKKFQPFVEGGLVPAIMGGSKIFPRSDKEISAILQPADLAEANLLNLGISFGIGFNYQISDQFQLFAENVYRYNFFSSSKESIKENLYAGGLQLGLRKSIGE